VFDPADSLLGHGKQQLSIAHDTSGGVMHFRVVNPECNHSAIVTLTLAYVRV
jgi:hypothetical protein